MRWLFTFGFRRPLPCPTLPATNLRLSPAFESSGFPSWLVSGSRLRLRLLVWLALCSSRLASNAASSSRSGNQFPIPYWVISVVTMQVNRTCILGLGLRCASGLRRPLHLCPAGSPASGLHRLPRLPAHVPRATPDSHRKLYPPAGPMRTTPGLRRRLHSSALPPIVPPACAGRAIFQLLLWIRVPACAEIRTLRCG